MKSSLHSGFISVFKATVLGVIFFSNIVGALGATKSPTATFHDTNKGIKVDSKGDYYVGSLSPSSVSIT